jgi:hypothetical protein
MNRNNEDAENAVTVPHKAARPMKVVEDNEGNRWLCDEDVDESEDLKEQGCWRCEELAFTRDD